MKKYFLILLLSVTIFCASAQVTLPNKVAEYYLEQDERAKQLDSLINIKQKRIDNLVAQIRVKSQINVTYSTDASVYKGIIKIKDDQITFKNKQLVQADKEVKRQFRQKSTVMGMGLGATIGSFIGQPLPGAVVGGGVGFVISLFKKKKKYEFLSDGG